jgi:hypothetical protein
MKKLWKYIAGFFTIVIGGVLAFLSGKSAGRKDEKFKGLKTESKKLSKSIKSKEEKSDVLRQTLANKKKALKEIEKHKYKKKSVGSKEAADFLKKYAKKKK